MGLDFLRCACSRNSRRKPFKWETLFFSLLVLTRQHWYKPIVVNIFLQHTGEFRGLLPALAQKFVKFQTFSTVLVIRLRLHITNFTYIIYIYITPCTATRFYSAPSLHTLTRALQMVTLQVFFGVWIFAHTNFSFAVLPFAVFSSAREEGKNETKRSDG